MALQVMATKHGGASFCELSSDDMFKVVEHELPYCRAAGSEALRLHPSVPKDVKFAVNNDVYDHMCFQPTIALEPVSPFSEFIGTFSLTHTEDLWLEPTKLTA